MSLGTRLVNAVYAARELELRNPDVSVMVADARFMKPLDIDLIRELVKMNDIMYTIEEGSIGGFGSHVADFLSKDGILDHGTLKFRSMYIPDIWIEAGTQKEQYDIAKLNEEHIVSNIEETINKIRNYRPKSVIDVQAETSALSGSPSSFFY